MTQRQVVNVLEPVLRSAIELTRLPNEEPDDILAGAQLLAGRRARLLRREVMAFEDMPFSLSIFCWWPFKPSIPAPDSVIIIDARWQIFEGLSHDKDTARLEIVPSRVLTLPMSSLYAQLEKAPRVFWKEWIRS